MVRLTWPSRDVVVRCGFVGDTLPGDLAVEQVEEWKWGARSAGRSSIERDLRELLAPNSDLDVLVAHGRSDLVTPYSVTRYLIDHLPWLGPEERVTLQLYKGGHMFYFDAAARAAFTAAAAAFYRSRASPD